jgi:hypothetical protein
MMNVTNLIRDFVKALRTNPSASPLPSKLSEEASFMDISLKINAPAGCSNIAQMKSGAGALIATGFDVLSTDKPESSLDKLIKNSIEITPGMSFIHSITKDTFEVTQDLMNRYSSRPNSFCENNGFVIFIDSKSKPYVTRLTEENNKLINLSGLKYDYMFVPINGGEHFQDINLDRRFVLIKEGGNLDEYLSKKSGFLDNLNERVRELFGTGISADFYSSLSNAYDQSFLGCFAPVGLDETIRTQTDQIIEANKDVFKNNSPDKSLRQIIDIALKHNPDNLMIQSLKENISSHDLSKAAQTLLSGVVGFYDYSKHTDSIYKLSETDNFPEKVTVLALNGDVNAKNIFTLASLRGEIVKNGKAKEHSIAEEVAERLFQTINLKRLNIDELITVRVMKFKPDMSEDGMSFILKSPFDATKGEILRTSSHFTLNHKVSSHMYGDWDTAPYILLTPLAKMIENNGQPENFNTVDTWWNLHPGQGLVIPVSDAIYIEKVENLPCLFEKQVNGSILVKSKNFTEADISDIQEMLREDKNTLKDFIKGFFDGDMKNKDEFIYPYLIDLVVNKFIKESGFQPQIPGMHSWNGDDMNATYQSMLYAKEYGTQYGPHAGKDDSRFNKRLEADEKIKLSTDHFFISTQLLEASYLRETL